MTIAGLHRLSHRVETGAAAAALATMAVLPVLEIVLRRAFAVGVPGSILVVQHLTLIVTFLGAALAARAGTLLALSTASLAPDHWAIPLRSTARLAGALVAAALAAASLAFVWSTRGTSEPLVAGIPRWTVLAVMPLGYVLVAGRLAADVAGGARGRAAALVLVGAATIGLWSIDAGSWPRVAPALILVTLGLTAIGLPLFGAIGAIGMLAFLASGMPAATVPVDTCALASFPALPAIPLFTLAGGVLGAGRSSERLMRLLTAVAGWLPGGAAIATMLAFAFFTTLTGASGVTILSLGALMLPVLVRAGYPRPFALGLVTVSGSIGLLLPPSLPVILYGVYAQQRVDAMLAGAAVPGVVFLVFVGAWIVVEGRRASVPRVPFVAREAVAAFAAARWELMLPVLVLAALFGGLATMTEAAAATACYAVAVECVVFRELSLTRDMPRVLADAVATTGAFLIILGVALGLTDYLMVEGWPTWLLEQVQARIASPVVFLLALNAFLLLAGALMDVYSAIFVLVPLIAPMAGAYGIHPIHLGVIVLANLELGFLTPPMGENLFLSASRFHVPVLQVFRHAWPFYLALAAGVLVITYLPWLTLAPLRLMGF